MNEYMFYLYCYIVIAIVALLINAFIAGYNGMHIIKDDVIDSIFWPVSITILLGVFSRIIVEKLTSYKL